MTAVLSCAARESITQLAEYIEAKPMSQFRDAPFHPETHGQIQRWHQNLNNRILLENCCVPGDLENQIEEFVEHFIHQRYHPSLDKMLDGPTETTAIRCELDIKSIKYAANFSRIIRSMFELLECLDLLLTHCLRREPLPTHANLEMALSLAKRTGAQRTVLSHLYKSMDCDTCRCLIRQGSSHHQTMRSDQTKDVQHRR